MGLSSNSFLLGIDIGTSSTKACLYSDEGELVASATYEYKINYNIMATPQIYLLNHNKVIVAKKIGPEQAEEIIYTLIKQSDL